jgi:hypothetical protein
MALKYVQKVFFVEVKIIYLLHLILKVSADGEALFFAIQSHVALSFGDQGP